MKTIEINALKRENFGKKFAKISRREGLVPCNIYGNGDNININVDEKELNKLINTPDAFIIDFKIEGGTTETVVIREVQFHPVKDVVLHADFFRLVDGKPVVIDVPISTFGVSEGVKQGGKLMISKRKLRISALRDNLPDILDIDISNIVLGDSVFVKDLKYDNITIITPENTAVCAVKMTRAARGAAAAAGTTENSEI